MSGKRRIALTALLGAAALLSASMLAPAFGAPKAVSAVSLAKKLTSTTTIAKRADRNAKRAIKGLQARPSAGPAGPPGAARPARGERRPGRERRQGRQGRTPVRRPRGCGRSSTSTGPSRARPASATGTFREDTGIYDVFFNRDVSGCAYVASLGGPDAGTPPAGTVAVTNLAGAPKGLFVITRNSAGTNASLPFHVAVFC